jgi:hypothetical protein
MLRHGSLFSGIGGFDLAAEWAGWENVFHCEWNTFGQRVLKHYWPNAESFNDITKSDFSKYEHTIDIISGGFPCQPFSTAGKQGGTDDTRYLWPAMLDVIAAVKPRYVVGENVYGLVNWSEGLVFQQVCIDLEAEGYEVQALTHPIEDTEFGSWHTIMLHTPLASDNKVKYKTKNWKGCDLTSQMNAIHGTRLPLNPRFVAEIMGYPKDWTELPFRPGEWKP